MVCRHCGTEIADKAIVCYRCGAGTTQPVRKPAEIRPKRSPLWTVVLIIVLVLVILLLWYIEQSHPVVGLTVLIDFAPVKCLTPV